MSHSLSNRFRSKPRKTRSTHVPAQEGSDKDDSFRALSKEPGGLSEKASERWCFERHLDAVAESLAGDHGRAFLVGEGAPEAAWSWLE